MTHTFLESKFPLLRGSSYAVTSPATPEYNCIAWAAGDMERFWWPVQSPFTYWPSGIPVVETLESFILAFGTVGYSTCGNAECGNAELEVGFEKIAIYISSAGIPTHAARQLSNGFWTSKLGRYVDISHELSGLTNSEYGSVGQIMKRPI